MMIYDYIIYAANLSGLVSAIHFAKQGKKVLLMNHYGFMGGRITESLSLDQKIPNILLGGETKNIFASLSNNRDAFLRSQEDNFILNPESFKLTLQSFIEQCEVDLLFHVTPIDFENHDEYISLIVSGKEGRIELRTRRIIDASDSFAVVGLKSNSATLEKAGINLIASVFENGFANIDEMLNKKTQLRDQRYFIRLKPLLNPPVYFFENEIQNRVNFFEKCLLERKGRIQLIAPQAEVIFFRKEKNMHENIFHVNDICGEYSLNEEFVKSSALELNLGAVQ